MIHRLDGASSLLQAEAGPCQEVGALPSTASRVAARLAWLVASARRARVANTHWRRGSALETVPCAASAAPHPTLRTGGGPGAYNLWQRALRTPRSDRCEV